MPPFLLALIKLAIQFGGPIILGYLKTFLESKYPDFAKAIEELIGGLKDPATPNHEARSKAKECLGALCQPDLKRE